MTDNERAVAEALAFPGGERRPILGSSQQTEPAIYVDTIRNLTRERDEAIAARNDAQAEARELALRVARLEAAARSADKDASTAHDYIWSEKNVTLDQASGAIWRIHNALRPLLAETPTEGAPS